MRTFLLVLLALAALVPARAAEVSLVRVSPGYRSADSFERISEYFDGKENTSGQIICRTHPDSRAGYYFNLRLKNSGAEITGARAELQIITPFSTDTKTHTFACTIPSGRKTLQLGLTGPDWPADKPESEAVAWQLRLLAADGTELARRQSFLWALPEKK